MSETAAVDGGAIRLTRLPSGLTVVTERMERVETVSLGAYVATGTRHELAEENGISHFLEHMAFKGTARRSAEAGGCSSNKAAASALAQFSRAMQVVPSVLPDGHSCAVSTSG